VDPFQKRPNADLTLLDQDGRELSSVSIIESMTRKMELVMHLRAAALGSCTLQATLYYTNQPAPVAGVADPGRSPAVPVTGAADTDAPASPFELEPQVVDRRQVTFELPA
jgi:hypothetical protein